MTFPSSIFLEMTALFEHHEVFETQNATPTESAAPPKSAAWGNRPLRPLYTTGFEYLLVITRNALGESYYTHIIPNCTCTVTMIIIFRECSSSACDWLIPVQSTHACEFFKDLKIALVP